MREYTLEDLDEWESAYYEGAELPDELVLYLFRIAKENEGGV